MKGYRNAPKRQGMKGGLSSMRVRAPILGGNFGVWGGLFAVFDCSLAHVRKVEDPWNAILAAGCTGGILAARAGPRAMARNAAIGMVLIALIEGLTMTVSKYFMEKSMGSLGAAQKDELEPPIPPNFGSGLVASLQRQYARALQGSASGAGRGAGAGSAAFELR